jgi:CheY-like chemotaxis protein
MAEQMRILIVDDDAGTAETLGDILEASGYQVELAADGPQALACLQARPFDVVFLDIKMPRMNGVEVLRRMKPLCGVPAVMMTAYALPDLIDQAEREGVLAVLAKPLPVDRVLAFLAALSSARLILIVDDDPAVAETLQDILEARGHAVACATEAATALNVVRQEHPDLVLLDLKLPDENGYEVLQAIRRVDPSTAVLLMTGYGRELSGLVEKSLETGAFDCLHKPIDPAHVLRCVSSARAHRVADRLREPTRDAKR